MDISILTPESPDWSEIVSGLPHDIYHLPGYVKLASEHEGGEPVAVVAREHEHVLLMPLLLKEIPGSRESLGRPAYDATSPYGYSGPVPSVFPERESFLSSAFALIPEVLAGRGVASLFLRLHPLIELPLAELAQEGRVVEHGSTVGVPLQGSDEDLLAGFRKGHRRALKKVEQYSHEVSIESSMEMLDEFVEMYYENMERVGASSQYYFSPDYFAGLFASLAGRVHLAILSIEGEMAQGDILTEVNGVVQTHLGATRSAYLHLSPSVLLTFYECRWARERNNCLLHLGGGLGGSEDSLFQFKAGFSSVRYPFRTYRGVVDRPAYDRLIEAWQTAGGSSQSDDGADYFPPYRRPLGRPSEG